MHKLISKLCPKCGKNVISNGMDMCGDCKDRVTTTMHDAHSPIFQLNSLIHYGTNAQQI